MTPELQADDAERALEYFGFTGKVVVVPDDDPFAIGKQISYNVHRRAMEFAPKISGWLKQTLLSDKRIGGAGVHFVVDDGAGITMNTFAERVDLVRTIARLSSRSTGISPLLYLAVEYDAPRIPLRR